MNNGSQQDVPPYVAQGAPKVNFNVGLRKYWVAAREMDLPLPSTETASTARPRFGTGSGQNSQ